MTIRFAGGVMTNRADPSDTPLEIEDADARAMGWRDFLGGLTPEEQTYFVAPDANGEIGVTAVGVAARPAMGREPTARARRQTAHVLLLIDAARTADRAFFVLPTPVLEEMPDELGWVTDIVTGPGRGFRITINGYGQFPVEWMDLRTALGRTHRASRRSARDACTYLTRTTGATIAPRVQRQWSRRRMVGRRRGDTVERWLDRESTVTLFHELIHHVIVGRPNHQGGFDEWVETRARLNWLRANPRAEP